MRYIARITNNIPNIQIRILCSWLLAWQKINQENFRLFSNYFEAQTCVHDEVDRKNSDVCSVFQTPVYLGTSLISVIILRVRLFLLFFFF